MFSSLGSWFRRQSVARKLTASAVTTSGIAVVAVLEIRPVLALVERAYASDPEFLHLRLPPGVAVVLYRNDDQPTPALPASVRRLVLADLVLPWERQRLITMVQRLTERAVASGRAMRDTPPENRPSE